MKNKRPKMKKYREFWLHSFTKTPNAEVCIVSNQWCAYQDEVHVIEKSAFDDLQSENARLRDALLKIKGFKRLFDQFRDSHYVQSIHKTIEAALAPQEKESND